MLLAISELKMNMGILVYIKNLAWSLVILMTISSLWSCSKELDATLESDSHEKVFEVYANLSPQKYELSLSDTVWISINYNFSETLFDMVSAKEQIISDAKFFCAIQIEDQIEPDRTVNFTYVLKEGTLSEREGNALGITFGHPETVANLKLGIVLEDAGRYAIWFNNTPNPISNCKTDCSGDLSYFYDVYYNYRTSTMTYATKDFVDYKFSSSQNLEGDSKIEPYLEYAIYKESIFVCTIR